MKKLETFKETDKNEQHYDLVSSLVINKNNSTNNLNVLSKPSQSVGQLSDDQGKVIKAIIMFRIRRRI